ncbi:iron dicitrate transport regulator FecR [Pedobacter ginsengisoli]|uniref:Iron dicitrate transport regulator FecR n=1 Tax=Pedobacter ginsengisoli TaxID=363852 RepID=A0A2D1U3S3_9SPHI|nr:FecR family protein [Pedobacter ginsengisoli]ATP56257.1 iron dicitrate transport regulator FecR [Pedobacter ginsengisoli]
MDNHHLYQPDWDKVLSVLNGELPASTVLTADELVLLDELKAIKTSSALYSDVEFDADSKIEAIRKRLNFQEGDQTKSRKLWPKVLIAAAVALMVVSSGIWFLTGNNEIVKQGHDVVVGNDLAPGKNTATLTLSNGSTIVLSDAKTGVVVGAEGLKYNDNSSVISKEESDRLNSTGKGSLPYGRDDGGGRVDEKVNITSVATPRGGTYQITLPDGTKVWLNAASSLSFPSTFQGLGNRKVELSGEAYFEVAKDKKHQFIVATDKQEVEVLGTHFNINSYTDESSTKTTLLEGSVAVRSRDLSSRRDGGAKLDAVVLKPNQQAILKDKGIKVIPVVGETYVDWKEGVFNFRKEELASIMRKVSRWYNVEIVYREVSVDGETYSGYVSRSEKVSGVLNTLAKISKLKFEIEKNKITVSK